MQITMDLLSPKKSKTIPGTGALIAMVMASAIIVKLVSALSAITQTATTMGSAMPKKSNLAQTR